MIVKLCTMWYDMNYFSGIHTSDDTKIGGKCAVGERNPEHDKPICGTCGSRLDLMLHLLLHLSWDNCSCIAHNQNCDFRFSAPTVSAILRQFPPKTRVCIFLAQRHVDRNQKPYTNVRRLIISTTNRYTYAFDSDMTYHSTREPDKTRHESSRDTKPYCPHPLTRYIIAT